MDTFDVAVQQLSKGFAEKISRRDLIKLIAKVTVTGVFVSFGIHRDEPNAILACPACAVPCDNRLVCKQYAYHYEPCVKLRTIVVGGPFTGQSNWHKMLLAHRM